MADQDILEFRKHQRLYTIDLFAWYLSNLPVDLSVPQEFLRQLSHVQPYQTTNQYSSPNRRQNFFPSGELVFSMIKALTYPHTRPGSGKSKSAAGISETKTRTQKMPQVTVHQSASSPIEKMKSRITSRTLRSAVLLGYSRS